MHGQLWTGRHAAAAAPLLVRLPHHRATLTREGVRVNVAGLDGVAHVRDPRGKQARRARHHAPHGVAHLRHAWFAALAMVDDKRMQIDQSGHGSSSIAASAAARRVQVMMSR